jgi:hypothetical protein
MGARRVRDAETNWPTDHRPQNRLQLQLPALKGLTSKHGRIIVAELEARGVGKIGLSVIATEHRICPSWNYDEG